MDKKNSVEKKWVVLFNVGPYFLLLPTLNRIQYFKAIGTIFLFFPVFHTFDGLAYL